MDTSYQENNITSERHLISNLKKLLILLSLSPDNKQGDKSFELNLRVIQLICKVYFLANFFQLDLILVLFHDQIFSSHLLCIHLGHLGLLILISLPLLTRMQKFQGVTSPEP